MNLHITASMIGTCISLPPKIGTWDVYVQSRLGDVGPADRQLIAGTWGRCAADCDDVPPSYRVASRFSTPFQIQTTIVVFSVHRFLRP